MYLEQYEKEKYQEIWKYDNYRKFSPGERIFDRFHLIDLMKDLGVKTVMDAGCGTGKLMRRLLEDGNAGFDVNGFDIAENCLDPYFDAFKHDILKTGVLWDSNDFNKAYDAIICTDVLEHIPVEKVGLVLENFFNCTIRFCHLGIALVPDSFGPGLMGDALHLTVKPAQWWLENIEASGFPHIHYIVDEDTSGREFWLHVFLAKEDKANAVLLSRL